MEGFLISNALPTDMILEILLDLPVRSLLRFKCVCKSWNTFINSNKFITMHLDRSRYNKKEGIAIKSFIGKASKSKTSFSIISNINDSSSNSVDENICLGLTGKCSAYDLGLLAHCDGIVFDSNYSQGHSVLCNLATRETILLPKPRSGNDCFTVGFGYDLKNHLYKAVRITESAADFDSTNYLVWTLYNVEVYTLGASSWREVKKGTFNSLKSGQINGSHGGFYFNGAIHWQGWYPEIPIQRKDFVIILFNLGDEEFQIIRLPDDAKPFQHFLVRNGSFAISATHCNHTLLDVFVMKEYGVIESWTKIVSIEIGGLRFGRPLTIWKNDEILLEITDDKDRIHHRLASYDQRKREFKDLQIHGCPRTFYFEAFIYMESLVSIRSRRESIA